MPILADKLARLSQLRPLAPAAVRSLAAAWDVRMETSFDQFPGLGKLIPSNRPLADFLPTITIKAKDFANEITTFSIGRDGLATENAISREHVKNNTDVRELLVQRNIHPESLPPAEDLKKVERRLKSEEKKLPRRKSSD